MSTAVQENIEEGGEGGDDEGGMEGIIKDGLSAGIKAGWFFLLSIRVFSYSKLLNKCMANLDYLKSDLCVKYLFYGYSYQTKKYKVPFNIADKILISILHICIMKYCCP